MTSRAPWTVLALACATTACVTQPELVGPPVASPLSTRWELEPVSTLAPYQMRPHRQNYALLGRWSSAPNQGVLDAAAPSGQAYDLDPLELEFQLSFKLKLLEDRLFGGDLWTAYTQLSHWQAYNLDDSAPFRETNYEPELIWTLPLDAEWAGVRARMLNLGFVHQSNGRGEALSRSWNRVYGQVGVERGDVAVLARGWWRIPESDDNNPDIEEYLGYGDLLAVWTRDVSTFSLLLRHNLDFDEGRGALQLDWSFPLDGHLRGYVQLFHGYGETLLDYDHQQTAIGIGFLLTDLL